MSSSFVCAALPSVQNHIDSGIKHYPTYMDNKIINDFLVNNVNKFLSSIGVVITRNCKVEKKLIDKYCKLLKNMYHKEYMENTEIIVDSGGFSIQQGYFKNEDIPEFIKLYHDFLNGHYELFNYAFTLDLSAGFDSCPFKTWKELEELNIKSYEMAVSLPQEIRDKILYIHHFRTPKLFKIYKKMFYDLDFVKHFKNFSTGGLVSLSNTKNILPCVMYVVPLVHILDHAKKNNIKKFRFHVLGGTEFKSIFEHCFFEKHIKKVHGIDVEITYDSSTIFKVLAMGRYTYVLDKFNKINKMSIRSDSLNLLWQNEGIISDLFYDIINNSIAGYGFKNLNNNDDPLYIDNKLNKIIYIYGIFQMFNLFKVFQNLCRDLVDKIYPYYENEEYFKFNDMINDYMIKFNGNKISKKIDYRINNVKNSLDLLTSLDLDYVDYLVDNYMVTEEFQLLN
jgi:hypothetical protein